MERQRALLGTQAENRRCADTEARIMCQCSQDKEGVFRLDAIFIDLDFLIGGNPMACKKAGNVERNLHRAGKERGAEFIVKVAMDVHLSALGVDQHASSIVVEKKRNVQAL